MTDRDILMSLILSLTLCESEADVADAVRKTLGLMEIEVEWKHLSDLGQTLDEMGVKGLWNEEVGD